MTAYLVVTVTATGSPLELASYRERVGARVSRFGGRYLARSISPDVREREWKADRCIQLVGASRYRQVRSSTGPDRRREVTMEPVTLIATAIAIGASDGARETTKKAIGDAYGALKGWITRRYGSVSAEVEGLEHEPDEELRRALLAKKLDQAGAGADEQLLDLAKALLVAVDEDAPELPATVGVVVRRASVGGDIEVINVVVDGGTGVVAEDVAAGGSLRIEGVATRSLQEPPHPPMAREQ